MRTSKSFSLITYLKADLRRSRLLTDGVEFQGVSLWFGIFSPRFLPVLLCRLSHWFYCLKWVPIAKFFSLLNFFLFGIEIAMSCPIGKGLFLPHTQGTVIGAWAIGENVTIFQGVTLGARELDFSYIESVRPIVSDNVIIGSGAKVLGGVVIGAGSRIGANAVVLTDVGDGMLAVGIPARVFDKAVQGQ